MYDNDDDGWMDANDDVINEFTHYPCKKFASKSQGMNEATYTRDDVVGDQLTENYDDVTLTPNTSVATTSKEKIVSIVDVDGKKEFDNIDGKEAQKDVTNINGLKEDIDEGSMMEEGIGNELTQEDVYLNLNGGLGSGSSSETVSEAEVGTSQESLSSSENNKLIGGIALSGKQFSAALTDHNSKMDFVNHSNSIAKQLETKVSKLNEILELKENEWTAILRLKKHAEYALEQIKCAQRQTLVKEEPEMNVNVPISMTEHDVKSLVSNLIMPRNETLKKARLPIESSIKQAETERSILETVYPFESSSSSSPGSASSSLSTLIRKIGSTVKTDNFVDIDSVEMKRKATCEITAGAPTNKTSKSRSNESATLDQSPVSGNRRRRNKLDELAIMRSRRNLGAHEINSKPKNTNIRLNTVDKTSDRDYRYFKIIEAMTTQANNLKRAFCGISPRSRPHQPSRNRQRLVVNSNSLLSPRTSSKRTTGRVIEEGVNAPESSQQVIMPMCQGCDKVLANFVCSSCQNQWYCSRKCQVDAWPDHMNDCPS